MSFRPMLHASLLAAAAMLLSLRLPWLGFALVSLVLLSYIRPELPGRRKETEKALR